MKIFLIGTLWTVGAFVLGMVARVILHHFRPRRRNYGVPPFKTGGFVFVCCEHDEECERGGVPCADWQKQMAAKIVPPVPIPTKFRRRCVGYPDCTRFPCAECEVVQE